MGLSGEGRASPRSEPTEAEEGELEQALDSHHLTSGGAALPPLVRATFEQRFRRDFSQVRVHTGPRAARVVRRLGARAVTYGAHVWLGSGEPVAVSATLAHELVHVVQQTGPRVIRARGPPAPIVTRSSRRARRVPVWESELFWEPKTLKGNSKACANPARLGSCIHSVVLPRFKAKGKRSLWYEVRIPNATRRGPGRSAGKVDLYSASAPIGVYFPRVKRPKRLPKPEDHRWSKHRHNMRSAPYFNSSRPNAWQQMQRVGKGPTKILLGDLKPAPYSKVAQKGVKQLGYYKAGIERTQQNTNAWVAGAYAQWGKTQRKAGKTPRTALSPPTWGMPQVNWLDSSNTTIPASPFGTQDLVVKQSVLDFALNPPKTMLVHDPVKEGLPAVRGRMKIVQAYPGVFSYVWLPDRALKVSDLPANVEEMDQRLTDCLVDPLKATSQIKATSKGCLPLRSGRPAIHPSSRRVRRKTRRRFNLLKWKRNHKALAKRWRSPALKKSRKRLEHERLFLAVDKNLQKRGMGHKLGTSAAPAAKKHRRNANTAKRLGFYTSPLAVFLARGRKAFGTLFTRLSRAYKNIKERFSKRMKMKSGVPSGIWGNVVKAVLSGLLRLGQVVVSKTVALLGKALAGCFAAQLKSWFGGDNIEALQKRAEHFKASVVAPLENLVAKYNNSKALAVEMFKPYAKKIDRFRKMLKPWLAAFKWGTRIYKFVKYAACIMSAGLGCLVRVGLKLILNKILKSCWAMQKITALAMKIRPIAEFINGIPPQLVKFLLKGLTKLPMPTTIKTFLGDCSKKVPTAGIKAPAKPGCGSTAGGIKYDLRTLTLINLLTQQLTEDQLNALIEHGNGTMLDWSTIDMAKLLQVINFLKTRKPDQIRTLLEKLASGKGKKKVVPIRQLLDAIKEMKEAEARAKKSVAAANSSAQQQPGGQQAPKTTIKIIKKLPKRKMTRMATPLSLSGFDPSRRTKQRIDLTWYIKGHTLTYKSVYIKIKGSIIRNKKKIYAFRLYEDLLWRVDYPDGTREVYQLKMKHRGKIMQFHYAP